MNMRNQCICWTSELIIILLSSSYHATGILLPKLRDLSTAQLLAASVNNFGASLTSFIESQDNVFISPYSIYMALAMTHLGTKGNTHREIKKALQLQINELNKNLLHESLRNFSNGIKECSDKYDLFLANGMFMQQNINIENKFIDDIKHFYDATIEKVDFNHQTVVKDKINKFVANNTSNKITEFLMEPLDKHTVLALINSIYFQGTWKATFPRSATKDGTFFKTDNSTKTVKFMTLQDETFSFYQDDSVGYKFIKLPYKGNSISMLLALPVQIGQVPDLNMNADFLYFLKSHMKMGNMHQVIIPKFQLKFNAEMKEVLKQLGIQDLFSASADLTGIQKEGNILVSSVMHEAVIDVNEDGSKAAGSTGVIIRLKSAFITHSFDFCANHPFAFYIIENESNIVLFSGRVFDP